MLKRFLVSLLMVVIVIAIVAVCATLIFQDSFANLSVLQQQAAQSGNLDDAAPTVPAILLTPVPSEEAEESTTVEAPTVSRQPADSDILVRAKNLTADMSLHEKLCQLLFVSPETLTGYTKVTRSSDVTREALEEYPVGGVLYSSNNLVTMNQTREMVENIQAYARSGGGTGLFLAVTEEGGEVSLLSENLGTEEYGDMASYGEAGDAHAAYELGFNLAETMKDLGFNLDLAPVADVLTDPYNPVLGPRSFGDDPAMVSEMITQEVRGFVDGGVLCAPKYFPGYGDLDGDPEEGPVTCGRSLADLQRSELLPYQAAISAGAPVILVGHTTMIEIDDSAPASLSGTLVQGLLRGDMGFDGVVITDDLSAGAITESYRSGEAAVQAIQAGCDMLLGVTNMESVLEALEDAVETGVIPEARIDESVQRILAAKIKYGIV